MADKMTDGNKPIDDHIAGGPPGSHGAIEFTQPNMASPEMSQTAPEPSTPAHHTELGLSPEIPPYDQNNLPSTSCKVSADHIKKPKTSNLGPRPKRYRCPPDYYGINMTQQKSIKSHGSRSSRSKRTHTAESASSFLTSSQISRHSRSSLASNLSDLQVSILEEKMRDELEELKRQRQEEEELEEKRILIDEEARAAQEIQHNAQKEREKIVRQINISRHI